MLIFVSEFGPTTTLFNELSLLLVTSIKVFHRPITQCEKLKMKLVEDKTEHTMLII